MKSSKMGQKKIDMNFRYGIMLFEEDVADKVIKNGLTGIEFINCTLGRERNRFKEGRILYTFPKTSDKTIIKKEDICNTCGRSGHYDAVGAPTEYWNFKNEIDNLSHDFYMSWEYHGTWDMGQTFPVPIVSQRFRCLMIENYKLRHLRFEPILEQE